MEGNHHPSRGQWINSGSSTLWTMPQWHKQQATRARQQTWTSSAFSYVTPASLKGSHSDLPSSKNLSTDMLDVTNSISDPVWQVRAEVQGHSTCFIEWLPGCVFKHTSCLDLASFQDVLLHVWKSSQVPTIQKSETLPIIAWWLRDVQPTVTSLWHSEKKKL